MRSKTRPRQTPPAILGSATTRASDIDFWPNIDYLATKSPTSQKIIVDVDLNNDNVLAIRQGNRDRVRRSRRLRDHPVPWHNAGHFAYSHTVGVDYSKGSIYVAETLPDAASRSSCR